MGLYTKSFIAGLMLSLCFNIQLRAELLLTKHSDFTQFSIIKSEHPSSKPEGLYVTVFSVKDMAYQSFSQYKYRIYCPTLNVRNISQGVKNAPMRTVIDEDRTSFKGNNIVAEVANVVCTKKSRKDNRIRSTRKSGY